MKLSEINSIAKEQKIYAKIDYIGKGFEIFLPKGAKIINDIQKYVEREKEKLNCKIVKSPMVSNPAIYKIEDRYNEKKEIKLFAIEKEEFDDESLENNLVLKPYVAPFHCTIFKSTQHSYKELPIKFFETSSVVRNELDIKGKTKTRQLTQSTSSIFTSKENIQTSIKEEAEFEKKLMDKLGIDVQFEIENWNEDHKEDYIGEINEWNYAVLSMENALNELQIPYKINKNGKMFGPRIAIKHNNYLISNIQVDFEITHRFDLKYKNKVDEDSFPYYINNTLVESYEDLVKLLIEKYNGNFPENIIAN